MNNYWKTVKNYFQKLLVILFLFTVTRVVFLLCNLDYVESGSFQNFIGGLRFDIAAISIINLPFTILYCFPVFLTFTQSKASHLTFAIINLAAIALNLIDCAYFSFTLKRTTADFFSTKGIAKDIWNLLPSFIADFWYLFLLTGLICWAVIVVFRKIPAVAFEKGSTLNILGRTGFTLLLLAASVIGYRGGLQLRPINIVTAGSYGNSRQIALVLNTPFTLIRTATQKQVKTLSYFNENELNRLFPLERTFTAEKFNNKNVVVIVMESFGEEYIGSISGLTSYTPFLDSLIPHCSRPEHGFANGRKSIEAMPAITASIPTLSETPFVSSSFAGNEINALPAILKKKGYHTSFFHGGQNGTMGFDVYAQLAGYSEYYGMNEYPNPVDYDGKWGIPDEPFLLYFNKQLSGFKQPFVTTVFTLSSHHPFTVPAKYQSVLPTGTLPIHQSLAYADLALRKFFEAARKEAWFANTIFVITGDHTSLTDHQSYTSAPLVYAVPILFYEPGIDGQVFKGLGQHLDITPTVLSMLGYNGKLSFFGNNLQDSTWDRWNLNYLEGSYQYLKGLSLLSYADEMVKSYVPTSENLKYISAPPVEDQKKLEMQSKAIIQQYNNRQLSNRLTRP